ncbi:uncharacterized protein LOC122255573 [Penaeus japonicus]|uniref:uncharacterized protein LOC122255573 n=1 Tax=Penaeus japonicus TaxID=27405 RepID=UPI001C714372|nr:uncharacterized protein LOC122255573 [Penaeus japonicus]
MWKVSGMRLLVALVLAGAVSASSNANSGDICDCECCVKPHPTDCTAYYYCEPGHLAEYFKCSEGLVFHPEVRQCVLQVQYPQCQIGSGDNDECDFTCPIAEGLYAHPRDCNKWVYCSNSEAFIKHCPDNLHFDAAKQVCDWPNNVQCTQQPEATCDLVYVEPEPVTPDSGDVDSESCDFTCPEQQGMYAHPRDCSKFVSCANSQPSTSSCPPPLVFNAAKKVCDWSDNVQCTSASDAECVLTIVETITDAPVTGSGVTDGGNDEDCDFVCPEVEGIYAHPRDCSKFVSCANSKPSTSSCPQNLIFNAAKKVCDWSDNVQCTSSSDAECVLTIVETVTDAPVTGSGVTDGGNDEDCDFVCPEVEGIYAHPRDCSKFVSCANSKPSTSSCPPNLLFNAAKKVCDWSDNVQCTSSLDAECVLTIVETVTDAPVTGSGVTDGGNDEDCDFVCPEVEGIYAHPRDCSKFVSCANSKPSTLSCPQNLLFNAAKKVCDWSDNVQCTCSSDAECVLTIVETITDAPVTGSGVTDGGNDEDCDFVCPEVEGIYAHPRDCSKFVSCANSKPSTSSCPQNLLFNAAKKVCDWSDNVQCTSTTDAECVLTIVETVTDAPVTGSEVTDGGNDEDCDFVCPEVEGIYAHPRDCSKFVSCANSKPSTLSCPQNLIFNAAKKVCDWSDNVQCTCSSDAECVLTIVETITDAPVTGSGVTDGGNDEDCDFVCPEVEGIYAHPRDCSKFVSCANSKPSTLSCPQNLIFNAAKKVCDWSDNVQCTCSSDAECVLTIVETVTDAPVTGSGVTDGGNDEDCDFVCPEVEGIYAHPRDCSKFVSCANSKPSTLSCPQNLIFNAAKKVCDWSDNVQCTSSSDAECVLTIVETITDAPVTGSGVTDGGNDEDCDFVCPEVEGIYAHPRDCSKFVSCANSEPSTLSCPQNLIFNAAKKVCDWSDNVQCTCSTDAECVLTIVETVTDAPVTGSGVTDGGNDEDCDFVCPEVEGIYAHPRDCSKFVSCANSKPSTSNCPQNLLFNAAKKVCDWSDNVQCTSTTDAECVLTIVETVTDAPVTGSGVTDGGNDEDCDFVCPEVEGIYAHPRDCSKFVSCANSKPSTLSCPQNLIFNAAKKVCDWSDNVQCTSSSDAECVLTINETPVPTTPKPTTPAPTTPEPTTPEPTTPEPTTPEPTTPEPTTPEPTTPEPTTPEPTTPEPTTPEPTTPEPTTPEPTTPEPTTPEPTTPEPTTPEPTTPEPTTPEPTTPEPTTPEPTTPAPTTKPTLPNPNPDICDCECCTKPHPEDCTSYYYCAPGADAQFNSCSEGLVFHPDFKQCVLQALYPQCQPEVPPTCDPTCECLYPSEICSEYYKCNREGTPIKYECTGGLLYNKDKYSCDLPQNVVCSGKTTPAPTTPAPTTPAPTTPEPTTPEPTTPEPTTPEPTTPVPTTPEPTTPEPTTPEPTTPEPTTPEPTTPEPTTPEPTTPEPTTPEPTTPEPTTPEPTTPEPTTPEPTTPEPTTPEPTTPEPTTPQPTTPEPTTPEPTTPEPTTPEPTTPEPTTPEPTTPEPTTPEPTTPEPTTPEPTTPKPTTPEPTTPKPTTPEPTTPEPTTPEPTTPEPTTPEPTTPEPTTPKPTTPEPTTPEPTTPEPTTPEPTTPKPTTPEPTTPEPTTPEPTLPNPNTEICDCECCNRPHPEDCTSYYYCAPGFDAQFHSCSDGLVFHPDFKQCVLQALYSQCQPEPTTPAPTTPEPTTPEPTTPAPTTPEPTTTGSDECDFVCPENGLYPHPRKCSEYVSCVNSVATVQQCSLGLQYNPTSRSCDYPKFAKCNANEEASCTLSNPPAPPRLPNPNTEICDCECCLKPHPEDCSSFYYCAPGADAQFFSCSEGLVFHPDFKQCVYQLHYPLCQPEVPPTCDPTCECIYPAEVCSSYYKCNGNGRPIKNECIGGLLYNNNIYSCDLPQNVQCSGSRRKRSVTYGVSQQYVTAEECKQLEGKFAVRDNPNAYYLCSHGTAHLMRCPDLAVFSSAAQDCIFMK